MKKVLIPKIKISSGFEFFDMGNGKYLYQEDRRKEIIDEEKLKKIKRRIVDKIYKSTPAETLQFAFNSNLICDQLFK